MERKLFKSKCMSENKKHTVFIQGAISPEFIANSIANHSKKKNIGAHSIFLGQIRNDTINETEVESIEYTAYEEMAEELFHQIRESAFEKYLLTCMHIYHSLGNVKAGEISLFVFTSSKNRSAAIDACSYIVNRIKKEVPIWGKEIFIDKKYEWKVNS